MASKTTSPKKMVQSITVRVPQQMLTPNPQNHCNRGARILYPSNFKNSAAPVQFMFYLNGSWIQCPSRINEPLRSGFVERKVIVPVEIDGSTFHFDFVRMVQTNLTTGSQRSFAWIDENGKNFFPKMFICEEVEDGQECPSLKGEGRVNVSGMIMVKKDTENVHEGEGTENRVNVNVPVPVSAKRKIEKVEGMENRVPGPVSAKRKIEKVDEDEGVQNRVNVPGPVSVKRKIEKVDEDEVTSSLRHRIVDRISQWQWQNVRLLREDEKPYEVASNLFLTWIRNVDPAVNLTAVHQCVRSGPMERARLEVFQRQMEITKAARGGTSRVVYGWFGASASDIRGILTHGFGAPNNFPGSHGVGLHLSQVSVPHLSAGLVKADENGEKHLLLCRVILGNVEKVDAGSQQCYSSSREFDCGSDNPENPKWYVVWSTNMNRHVIPECVVSYRPADAALGGSGQKLYPIGILLTMFESRLPPSKYQELVPLFQDFKAGKMAKTDLYRQIRAVTGEELMLSVARELLGS